MRCFQKELEELKKKGLLRSVVSRGSAQGRMIRIGGRRVLNFSSNDYLGLAGRREMIESAKEALELFGTGSGASRLLAGGTTYEQRLEEEVAAFKATESALLFSSGYAANTGIIPAIAAAEDMIFSDELNHASIIDGCRLSRARTVVYRHCDMDDLKRLLRRARARKKVIVTDSVFSMDGDIAPLDAICDLCIRHGCLLYVDDAHATGVLGGGHGSLAHFGIPPELFILQMGTFSKALGSYGAFAAGSNEVISWLRNRARTLLFSTALPAHVAAASITALGIARKEPALRERLWRNREILAKGLREAGYDIGGSVTPIVPVMAASVGEAVELSEFLFGERIYAPAIRPPSVRNPRIRLAIGAAHTQRDIRRLLSAFEKFRRES